MQVLGPCIFHDFQRVRIRVAVGHLDIFILEDVAKIVAYAQTWRSLVSNPVGRLFLNLNTYLLLGFKLFYVSINFRKIQFVRVISKGKFQLNSSIRSKPEAHKAKRKVTRLVSTILFIWAICWLPLNICFFLSGSYHTIWNSLVCKQT